MRRTIFKKASPRKQAGLVMALAGLNYSSAIAQNAIQTERDIKQPSISAEQPSTTTAKTLTETDLGKSVSEPVTKDNKCRKDREREEWVDKVRHHTHTNLCNTVSWIDGLFGDERDFDGEKFRGKVSLGFRQDEVDGFDPRIRVRIRTQLPNMSKRFNAFIGRVEEDSYISNTEVDQDRVNAVGLRSTNDEDSEWLVGLGYRNPNSEDNGLDYSVGAKLSGGFNPYARAIHRHLFKASESNYWRTTQTVFWQRDDGFGVSSSLDYTHIVGDRDIIEWDSSVKYTEEEELEWITSGTWHHEFTPKTGISSRAYVRGESDNPVSIPEFGVTFTYIRPFLRDWLFIETGIDWRWERESIFEDEYKSAVRVGFQFEMLLGDYYRRGHRFSHN